MLIVRVMRAARDRLARLAAAQEGVAAVEFAMLLPLMITLYLGSFELTQGVMASRKTALLSRTLSDIVSQQPSGVAISQTTLTNIFNAAAAVLAPLPVSAARMSISSVEMVAATTTTATTYNGFDATVHWSVISAYGGTARACAKLTPVSNSLSAAPNTLPQGLYSASPLIIADVSYTYTPTFGTTFVAWSTSQSGIAMKNTTYARPRNWSTYITISSSASAACTG